MTVTVDLNLVIDDMVYQKVMYWVRKSKVEVSGLGKVVVEDNTVRVIDAMLLPQTNTASSTDIDAEGIAKAMFELKDTPGELKWWWHSHATMGVFWSGTDRDTIKELSGPGWFAATVFNHKAEMKSAFALASPIKAIADDIPTIIGARMIDKDIVDLWDLEYDENIKVPSYKSWNHTSNSKGSHHGSGRRGRYKNGNGLGDLNPSWWDRLINGSVSASDEKNGASADEAGDDTAAAFKRGEVG